MGRIVFIALILISGIFLSCSVLSVIAGSGISVFAAVGAVSFLFALFLPSSKRIVVGINLIIIYLGALALQAAFVDGGQSARRTWGGIPPEVLSENPEVVPIVVPQRYLDMRPFVPSPPWGVVETSEGEFFPLSGLAGRQTLYCKEDDGWMIFQSDHRGFNNPGDSELSETLNLFIGDSFTQGACVPCGDGYVELVGASGADVYNAGMGGAGPLTELGILREMMTDGVKPGGVVWAYCSGNDLMRTDRRPSDLDLELSHDVLTRYLEEPEFVQNYFAAKEGIDAVIESRLSETAEELSGAAQLFADVRFLVLGGLVDMLRDNSRTALYQKLDPEYYREERLPVFREVLSQARDLCGKEGVNFYLLYLPTKNEAHPLREDVINLCDELGVSVIDADAVMPRSGANWTENGGHLSRKGYRELSELVGAFLEAESTKSKRSVSLNLVSKQ